MVKIDNFLSIYNASSTALENAARRSANGAKIYSKNAFGGEFDALLREKNSTNSTSKNGFATTSTSKISENSQNSVNFGDISAKKSQILGQNSVNFDKNSAINSIKNSQNLEKNSIIANENSTKTAIDLKTDLKADLKAGKADFKANLSANSQNETADEVAQSKAQARFDAALREQTDAFEAFLIKIILDVSLKKSNSLFGKDAGDEIYSAMYNDAVSKALSGGMGFSELLFEHLKGR